MFTLPISKKTPIQVVLKNGEKIYAKITRFDEHTGKVSWKDLDENWKGSFHVSKVVAANPEEFKAWQDAKTTKMAPMPTEMSRWSFGKTKRGPAMSDGYFFSSPILLDGKVVGEVYDEGTGGPVDSRFKNTTIWKQFENDLKEFKKNYPTMMEPLFWLWNWWDDGRLNGTTFSQYYANEMKELGVEK